MRLKLFAKTKTSINWIFTIFIFLTTYFALVSPNFTLGETQTPQTLGEKTTHITLLFLGCLLGLFWGCWASSKFRTLLQRLFITHALLCSSGLFILALLWQLAFLFAVHPAFGFDVTALHSAVIDPTDRELIGYFSSNTNNLFLLLIMHKLSQIFGTHSWFFFASCSVFLTFCSAWLNLISVWVYDRTKLPAILYIQALWLFVFPMSVVAYSDIWVLPLVSLVILCYILTFHSSLKAGQLFFAACLGITVAPLYFIKPSAVIPLIAMVLSELLFAVAKRPAHLKLFLACLSLVILGTGLSCSYTDHALKKQTYIALYPDKTIPPIHFISMGMTGTGGYDPKQALEMAKLPDRKARVTYSKKIIKQQLHKKGFFGYLRFLFFKQQRNTADGTFSWLLEGHFIKGQAATKRPHGFFQQFVYPKGRYLGDFRYLAQSFWLFLLLIITLGRNFKAPTPLIVMLKLAILGGFIYLLIFEGGRSRYLIQFLPLFLLLGSLSLTNTWQILKKSFAWIK